MILYLWPPSLKPRLLKQLPIERAARALLHPDCNHRKKFRSGFFDHPVFDELFHLINVMKCFSRVLQFFTRGRVLPIIIIAPITTL